MLELTGDDRVRTMDYVTDGKRLLKVMDTRLVKQGQTGTYSVSLVLEDQAVDEPCQEVWVQEKASKKLVLVKRSQPVSV